MLHHEAKMAVEEWFLQEEGCLQFNGRPTSVSYSPTSHCFIATLEDGSIEVLDVSSGRTLKRTFLEGTNSSEFGSLECRFCPGVEKLFVTDSRTVGLRKDLNGVLLLESILQAPVAEDCDTPITLELTLADAKQLQTGIESCITSAVPPVLDVMETLKEQLKKEINQPSSSSSSVNVDSKSSASTTATATLSSDESDKAAKWNTCKLRLPAGALLCAFDGMVTSLHKNHRTSAALPIASAMFARVMALTGTSVLEKKGQPVYKQLMFVEAARRQTFSTWPHTDYKWAYPEAMAQAGFYHQPACTGDDRAMCFTCSVCLVCWEPTDEPWSEHERHSAECPFVRGERTENVPMCVSLATTPAKHHGGSRKAKITSISSSSCPCLLATSSNTGHIVVWDLSDQLKVYSHFMVDSESQDNHEGTSINKDLPSVPQAWPATCDNIQPNLLDPVNQDLKESNSTSAQDATSPAEVSDCECSTATQENNQEADVDTEAQTTQQEKEESVSVDQTSTTADVVSDSDIQRDIIEVSCELNEDDDQREPSPVVEEPEESSQGIVEEPDTKLNDEQVPTEDGDSSSSMDSPKTPSLHVTAMAIMCPPDQDHQHLKKLHTAEHKPVVIAGVSPCLGANGNENNESVTENIPYLVLYDASPEKNTTTNKKEKEVHHPVKPEPKLPSTLHYGDSQDDELYDILSSDDELDQELMPVAPATIQSSLVKKCADAISGKADQQSEQLKMKQSNVIQKLMFPSDIGEINSRVSQIIPCLDGHHVLVVVHLKEPKESSEISSQGETNVYLNDDFNYKPCSICTDEKHRAFKNDSEGCLLLLYRLILSSSNLLTLSEPLIWRKLSSDNSLFNVIGLPVDHTEHFDYSKGLLVSDVEDDFNSCTDNGLACNGRFAGITQDGSILIINVNTLDTLTKFCPTDTANHLDNRFNDMVYCPGIDCLCCSTSQGTLYFLSLVHNRETTDSEGACHGMLNGADALIESISLSEESTIQNLIKLLQKIEFENLVPRFTAIVPPLWSEVQQEQQQRQHPQHLHQQSLGDATLHTRTWKLQPEGKNNAGGEQIFELLLPKQCHVGHIDIKYTLNNSTNSSVNAYLLKPWSLKSWQEDYNSKTSSKKVPILSAAKENGHILCGPIELQKGSHPRVALTCPDLVKTRHRILLLVFDSSQSSCPLEELSVTVRRFRFIPQLSCFMQYTVMLEEPAFHRRLIDMVCSSSHEKMLSEDIRKIALVLLCWIAGICVHTPIRKNSLIHQIQNRLPDIIPVCFLQSGRTVSHQCSVLLLLCARQSRWDKKYGISKAEQPFRMSLLQAILQVLPDSINAVSAGALHSLFSVLVGYAALADVKQTGTVCQEMLTEVSTKMDSLLLHSHNMLQGRYGLYGLPLEPVLFDLTVPPTAQSSTPKPVVTLSSVATSSPSYPSTNVLYQTGKAYLGPSAQRDPTASSAASKASTGVTKTTGLQDIEGPADSAQYLTSLVAHQGLLEVEPLHFTCTSTSDGARVERAESSQVVPVPGLPTAATVAGQTLSSMLPSVSVSTEPDIEFLKQHYQQLAKIQLQQHKQVLEKHKQELEELAMWSLFPKMLSKLEGDVSGGGEAWYSQPYPPHYQSGVSVNLAQQKKLTHRKSSSKKGLPSLTPIHRQHSQLPLAQALIIERLHSGARHHVVLDLGTAMELTDVIIPSCTDLSSLSIDTWLEGEDKDVQRVAIVSDIGSCDCVLKDLRPPPICQFIKITVVGRPRSNAKVRMKIGEFYGIPHTPSIMDMHVDPEHRIHMLENLYEEVHCHYSLACGKLESLLENPTGDDTKLQTIYQQCTDLQLQLNFVHHSIARLQVQSSMVQNEAGYDKMRVLSTCLAEALIGLIAIKPDDNSFLAKTTIPLEPQARCSLLTRDLCEVLFRNLCVRGNPVLRVRVAALLLHTCSTQLWWGAFLAQVVQQFFSSSQHLVFPQERVFVVLSVLAQQSPDITRVLTSLLSLLDEVLSSTNKKGLLDIQGIDISLVGWIVLLLAHILNTCGVGRTQTTTSDQPKESTSASSSTAGPSKTANPGPSDKWDFIVPSPATQTNQPTSNLTGLRHQHHKLRRKISKHEKYLQKQQKMMMEVQGSELSEVQNMEQAFVKSKMTSHALKQHIKDLVKLRHQEAEPSTSKGKKSSKSKSSKKTDSAPAFVPMLLPQNTTVPVMKKMIQLVLTLDSSCSVDLVLTICKVVALLSSISQPTVVVTDILSQTQVESILRLCVSCWGGAWTRHALITLLQDLIHGFKGDLKVFPEEEEEQKREVQDSSQPESKGQPSDVLSAPSMEEIWSTAQNVPMEWSDPGYDSPPPIPSPPPPVTSSLVIPPKLTSNIEAATPSTTPLVKVSSALDARLELGVTMESEWDLKTLQLIQTDAVLKGMTTSHLQRYCGYKVTKKHTSASLTSIMEVLSRCFNKLFSECRDPKLDLGCLLELWLRLSGALPGNSAKIPVFIPLSKVSMATMLSYLANCPTISLQNLYLAFEVMRSVLEKTSAIAGPSKLLGEKATFSLTEAFVSNPDLIQVLQKTLVEGSPKDYGAETGVGTAGTGIKQVEVFLSSLAVALEKHEQSHLLGKFHNLMLDLLCTLSSGNVHSSGRPLQVKPILRAFLKHPPSCTKELNVSLIMKLLQLTMELSLQHLQKKDEISLRASSHFHETPRLTTNSHFLEGKGLNEPWIVHSTWLTKLLSLIIMLLQLPAQKPSNDVQASGTSAEAKSSTNEGITQESGFKEESSYRNEASLSVGVPMEDASDSMVNALQAMAKVVEKNASQTTEESQPIINVVEEESSTSASETETSAGEDEEAVISSETGNVQEGDKSKPSSDTKEENTSTASDIKGDTPSSLKPCKSVLPDQLISNDQICFSLLECLNLCQSNNIGVLLTGANILNNTQNTPVSGEPVSVEDGILQVLSVIFSQLTHKDLLVSIVIKYLSGHGTCHAIHHMSEPFLWFLLRMLDSNQQVFVFREQGGYELLFSNLVSSYKTHLDDKAQDLIAVMRQLTKLAQSSSNGGAKLLLNAVWEAEKENGLVNYAPFGTISCTRPSAHPPDALLKACAPHRRARSAAWSYHFYPGELWCDLNIQLPTPILLHAVYVQPHTVGLTTCPSYVALDYSVDGTVMIPASKPVMTSGLSIIKLQFEQPQIAQRVCIRCRRPRDSESLGLSQIKIWGTSLYGPPAANLLGSNQVLQSDCLHWICLLDHCLHRTPSAELTSLSSSQLLYHVFDICISLLGSNRSELFSGCQEDVLHTLSLEYPELGQILLKRLLVNPGCVQSTQSVSVYSSSVQLVFKLAKAAGSAATQRLRIIAEWLMSLSSQAHISSAADNGLTGLIQAVAAVLWTTADSELTRIVQEEFKVSLFRSIYEWSQLIGRQEPLKQAIDYLMCSLCHVCPSYFQLLLHLTEAQSLVDQARTHDEQPTSSHPVFVCNPNSMETLSRASQSPNTSHLLLASGVLNVLHDATYRLCNTLLTAHGGSDHDSRGVHLYIDCLSDVLSFMGSCAEEPVIKSWFGESGSEFWKPLMLLLGSGMLFSPVARQHKQTPHLPTRHRIALESAAITFFCQCIACHPDNQTLFSKLLCEVMSTPCGMFTDEHVPVNTRGVGLDGFLRRLVLEALLQDETTKVCIHNSSSMKPQLASKDKQFCHNRDWHPRFGAGYNVLIFKAKLASTIEELDEVVFQTSSLSKATEGISTEEDKQASKAADLDEFTALGEIDILEGLSIAAGINVKSKRARTTTMLKKISSQKFDSSLLRQNITSPVCRHHSVLGDMVIPTKISLSCLANALMSKGLPIGTNCIEISLKTCGTSPAHINDDILLTSPALTSALHNFASFDGLAILSSRLSCSVVMNQPSSQDTAGADGSEVALPLAFPLPLFSLSASVLSRIPGHSLAAFGLFICLPGYSDVLLQDRPKAQCLLRLLLGAEDDGNGGHVLSSHVAGSLPTLPFQILRLLFHSEPLSNEKGVTLREVSLDQGAIQLVLMCLGVLSHHEPRVVSPTDRLALQTVAALTGNLLRGSDQANSGEKQYWAKGTGFGTGSTSSDWDIENAMKKQRAEEYHSTCMLQVLAAFIRPSGVQKLEDLTSTYSAEYPDSHKIPLTMMELLARSCLVPTLSSYLRNDSVLDMARHVPLYQAVLEVMRALATCPSLVHLLTPDDSGNSATSLAGLIEKMKQCVDTYSKTLRSTSQAIRRSKREKKPTQPTKPTTIAPSQDEPEGEQDTKESDAEGLALLIPDIQATATLIHDVLSHLHDDETSNDNPDAQGSGDSGLLKTLELSNEEKYLAIIKPLQFDMYEIVSEEDNDRLEFTISYHFAAALRSATSNGEMGSPARARRLAQEITSLSTSLPLSSSSSVFVRCDETRLDIMKVLITGPAETPYANGCFEFDVYFPHNYPNAPMQINFETTGHHTIRFNPNLYNDGKVCLSILNTWHGRPEEKWNPQTSSFLQVLVSTQSLILVAEPYFNEPGYERSRGTPAGKLNSQEYNANIRQASVKWGMLEQLRKPCKCFKEVIESHFYLKKDEILQQCETWIREIEALTLRNNGGRAALHHLHSLRQHTTQLRVELNKLPPPKQLQSKKNDS